ncbi:hypothetical protein M9H77_12591 [Catharanthus roseus]|uniref:Uncharacterized protein n=1 Tax=Catharanthus roseus TaxID=4058 RepID=A0ACC0BHX1_CATRO|nr:hypothetical protein M9H77_12591 [Catharanthus roseus]
MFAAGEDGRGLRTIRTVCPTASTERTVGRYTIRPILGKVKCQELKLMFEAAGGSNMGHVYGFCSQSATVTAECQGHSSSSMSSVPSVSFVAGHEACIKIEMRLWGYMEQAQGNFVDFMTSFASQFRGQLDSVPTLFPPLSPPDDDTTF